MKKNIYVATKTRGIFKTLFSENFEDYKFSFCETQIYDKKNHNWKNKIISYLGYSKLADLLGLIQRIDVKKITDGDYYWSYNRILKSEKPYILYLEHPLALFHYRTLRQQFFIGKNKMKKYLADPNLKAIVFQAKFTEETFDSICEGYKGEKYQIYPLIKDNPYVTEVSIVERCRSEKLKVLFLAQGSRFVSKCAPELIEAVKKIENIFGNIVELTILTEVSIINKKYLEDTKSYKSINWIDYNLNSDQMNKLYAENMLFVLVSSDDSINAAAQEAMKAGLPVVASCMSGFPELIEDGVTGYMTEPKYWFFGKDNKPNLEVWNDRKNTIYSEKIDDRIVDFIYHKLIYLCNNRNELLRLSLNSYEKSHDKPFSREYILDQWKNVFSDLDKQQK